LWNMPSASRSPRLSSTGCRAVVCR
jgi:hypothetical protein